ncbi:hypothetical protein PM082_017181 [Marasmius tenuissimus]|nr:hypothetical protein PM082_017181 [Marasmius tenuissimus]
MPDNLPSPTNFFDSYSLIRYTSTIPMSNFFRNARHFTVAGGSFDHIEGDQHSYYGPTTIIQKQIKKQTEFDEFYYVKRGAIYRLKDIGSSTYPRRWDNEDREWWEEGRPRADRTICAAKVLQQPGIVFTVIQYSGPDARRAFVQDFCVSSRVLTSSVSQIYGYNASEIPSLIFYNELIPVAHLKENAGDLGRMYISSLPRQLGCEEEELWVDPTRGVMCRGPPGPRPRLWLSRFDLADLPLKAELVREDVILRFLARFKSKKVDRIVVQAIALGAWTDRPQQASQPTVVLATTNTPIAVANNVWESKTDSLSGRKLLGNGLTRVGGTLAYVWLEWDRDAQYAWISQASSVFHACGTSLKEDLSVYSVSSFFALSPPAQHSSEALNPCAFLRGDLSNERAAQRRFQRPIYLFVGSRPPGMHICKTSSVHHWSFCEDGHPPLSHEVCRDLGFPVELTFSYKGYISRYWPNDSYKYAHQYQILRGFDPNTTDFARHLGFESDFQPLSDSDRFEQVQEVVPSGTVASVLKMLEGWGWPVQPGPGVEYLAHLEARATALAKHQLSSKKTSQH